MTSSHALDRFRDEITGALTRPTPPSPLGEQLLTLEHPVYLIWADRQGMWWRALLDGYTRIIGEAGRYSRAEAEEIVRNDDMADSVVMVPAPELAGAATANHVAHPGGEPPSITLTVTAVTVRDILLTNPRVTVQTLHGGDGCCNAHMGRTWHNVETSDCDLSHGTCVLLVSDAWIEENHCSTDELLPVRLLAQEAS